MTREAIVQFLSGDLLMMVYGWLCVAAIVVFSLHQTYRFLRRHLHGHKDNGAHHRVGDH